MSEVTDSASRKRCPSPDQDGGSAVPQKFTKVSDDVNESGATLESSKNCQVESKGAFGGGSEDNGVQAGAAAALQTDQGSDRRVPVNSSAADGHGVNATDPPQGTVAQTSARSKEEEAAKTEESEVKSDSAAIAAAEALASLTGGDGEDSQETPCSSLKDKHTKHGSKYKQRGGHQSSKVDSKTQAAAADSSTSVHSTNKEVGQDAPESHEGDESVSGSSSTPSSSFPSENEDNDDGECAIVSVKMAPEIRQSVALLANVQMRLEALEKKSARLHQRLEQKISRQRRPQLDQRSSITKTIPGFWVTAVSFM